MPLIRSYETKWFWAGFCTLITVDLALVGITMDTGSSYWLNFTQCVYMVITRRWAYTLFISNGALWILCSLVSNICKLIVSCHLSCKGLHIYVVFDITLSVALNAISSMTFPNSTIFHNSHPMRNMSSVIIQIHQLACSKSLCTKA